MKTTIMIIFIFTCFFACSTFKKEYYNGKLVNIKPPKKTVFLNLKIDTTKLFGTWSQDLAAPFPDFYVTKESFNIVDFNEEGVIPYILNKKEIIVFYKDAVHKGSINLIEEDILKIKWSSNKKETEYVKIKN